MSDEVKRLGSEKSKCNVEAVSDAGQEGAAARNVHKMCLACSFSAAMTRSAPPPACFLLFLAGLLVLPVPLWLVPASPERLTLPRSAARRVIFHRGCAALALGIDSSRILLPIIPCNLGAVMLVLSDFRRPLMQLSPRSAPRGGKDFD